ncbi:MAG: SAM-dependent chlorinase/fluorinase [bacterium]|nr:SAM-dependent chlorinase/fluorinase [bacterium]
MSEPLIIQLIADYGVGDPAFAEVIQKFTFLDRTIRIHPTSVPPFSTIATGIWISQLATVNAFPGLIVFSNTAPRKTTKGFRETTDGGRLVYAKLDNGAVVIAVNTGYCFSFIRSDISSLYYVNVPNTNSQFRSRDYYPDAVVGIAHAEKGYIGEEIPLSAVPPAPTDLIGFIDGYGNLKTTLRKSSVSFPVGGRLRIQCAGVERYGIVADETYKVKDGDISFAPGSTGGSDRFMEIWVRGGSAWEEFGRPKAEQSFTLELV